MKKRLTAPILPTLPQGDYVDDGVDFCLVFSVGKRRKTWRLRYRSGTKQVWKTLGYYFGQNPPPGSPHMGLADARSQARKYLDRIEAGTPANDPKPAHPKGGKTLGDLIDDYEKMRRKEGGRIKTLDEAMRTVRRGLKPYLKLPAKQFSKNDLRAARDAMNAGTRKKDGTTHMGNRLLGYTSPILSWAASEDLIPVNFARDIRRAHEAKRDRVLSRAELRAVWLACDEIGDSVPAKNFGRMIRFLIATGQRIGEAQAMKHGDLLGGIWRQSDNKASREHRLKLPKIALDQIGKGTANDLCFPGEAGTKIGALSKLKKALDDKSGVENWRIHDLRRSAASEMQEAGISDTAIRAVLNHAIPGVSGVYLRAELDRMKAEALADWAAELAKIIKAKRAA